MLRCREVVELVGTGALERASLRQRIAVRMHLLMCENCSAYVRSLRQLARAARALAGAEPPDEPAKRDAIVREVRRAAETKRD
jgi:predicted anti-sigma-YlaC factor YlaD